MEKVDELIEEYANQITINVRKNKIVSEDVNALAALIAARANHRMAFRSFGKKES